MTCTVIFSVSSPERGRSSIGFVRDAQVDMLGYESALLS
jgi:hypothetical protein